MELISSKVAPDSSQYVCSDRKAEDSSDSSLPHLKMKRRKLDFIIYCYCEHPSVVVCLIREGWC